MDIGYARVSSNSQNLDSQIESLQQAGCSKIFTEKKSGKQADNRPELKNALDFAREGDNFIVTRLDRCSRSVQDLFQILKALEVKGVAFKATEQNFDTSTSTGKLMLGILSVIAEFETNLRAERQADGIKSAIKRGVKFGRSRKLTDKQVAEIIQLQQTGKLTNQAIAYKYEIARSTLLREVATYKKGISEPIDK